MSRGISGNQGVAMAGGSTIAELTKWTYDEEVGAPAYNAQSGVIGNTSWQKTVQGNSKAEGTLEGKFDPAAPIGSPLNIGTIIALILMPNGKANQVTCNLSFNARITKIHREADIDTGAVQPFTASYVSDGPVAKTGV